MARPSKPTVTTPAATQTGLQTATRGLTRGLYEKRGWYYFQPPTTKEGKRPSAMSLRTQDLKTALDRMEERGADMALIHADRAGTVMEALPGYYASRATDTKASRRARKVVMENFAEATGNPRLSSIDRRVIDAWRTKLRVSGGKQGHPVSLATLRSYAITVRAFLNWARQTGKIRSNPMDGMGREVRVTVTRKQGFLTEDEREKLLAAESPDYVRLILMLGFFAGLRDGEMLALNPQWIWLSDDGTRGTLTVQDTAIVLADDKPGLWQPKCRKSRTIPLHPRLLEFLRAHGMRRPWLLAPDKDKWPTDKMNSKRFDAKKALHGVAKRAGVKKLTPHMLRHSFATHLSMKGVPLAEIAGLLGDSLKVTEEHYAGYHPAKINPLLCL